MKQLITCLLFTIFSIQGMAQERPQIEIQTNYGTMVLELYNETPQHRDNFLKLIEDKVYDSLIFHRVIEDFMIQAGDTESKNAKPGESVGEHDLPYQIPAEISPTIFHKKGSLGAARTNNPERASSSTQFYIVQGKIQNDSLLTHNQNRINTYLQRHFAINDATIKPLYDSLENAREAKDSILVKTLSDKLESQVKSFESFEKYEIPAAHREVYETIGGTPHLDQSYTVFGQVISGLEVVDAIAAVETNEKDRPETDVIILKMRIVPPPIP
ncbi:peptidylprolyl isomerase [Algoriphagus sp. PAP.12]|uniref:peptidylprolyl isomerase n=1 Tax=Algoriphagus sp. PAP.12 TaxID=2996678 RepID=UPI00227BD495|nr:peptidylprolyl isomerase [Algoriphagus sp. PAP.12]